MARLKIYLRSQLGDAVVSPRGTSDGDDADAS
jgi:hypothetical protein